jgi:hypothetical protein
MDLGQVSKFFDVLKQLFRIAGWADSVRADFIKQVNDLSTVMAMTSALAVGRLVDAQLAPTTSEKLEIVQKLARDDIEQFSRLNDRCQSIYTASADLNHWFSAKRLTVNLQGMDDAIAVLTVLQDGERGLQDIYRELLMAPSDLHHASEPEVDRWLRLTIEQLSSINQQANESVRQLAAVI